MNAQELAQSIVNAVEARERDVISPGNLQWIELTDEEKEVFGVTNDMMKLSQLKKIAKG